MRLRWLWLLVVFVAVGVVGVEVASNKILDDDEWHWEWMVIAIAFSLAVGFVAQHLTKRSGPAKDTRQAITLAASNPLETVVGALPPTRVPLQLRAPARVFEGRVDVLGGVLALLSPESAERVVSIVGPPGVGKTELAVQAGQEAVRRGWFPGGVVTPEMRGQDELPTTARDAVDWVLRELGVATTDGPLDTEERVAFFRTEMARARPMLVLADDVAAAEQVVPLLTGAPQHRVLITSRDRLSALAARRLDLAPLSVRGAVAVVDRAVRLAVPDDDRVTASLAEAERLVRACGCLPLALVIVGARLREPSVTVAEVADELLAGGPGPGRLDAVRAAFALSYRRLPPGPARLLGVLTAIPGPDTALATVAAAAAVEESEARADLDALVAVHLVERVRGDRWRLHDLVRLHGRDLSEVDTATVSARVVDHFRARLASAEAHLSYQRVPELFVDRAEAITWLDAERHSLVDVVVTGVGGDEAVAEMALLLVEFLLARRALSDLEAVATEGVRAAARLDEPYQVQLLVVLATVCRLERRFAKSIEVCERAIALADDEVTRAPALASLGATLLEARRFDDAIEVCERAVAAGELAAAPMHTALALNNLGVALHRTGRADEALTHLRRARDMAEQATYPALIALSSNNLAAVLADLGQSEALSNAETAVAEYEHTDNRHLLPMSLTNLAGALVNADRPDEALAALARARDIAEQTGDDNALGRAWLATRDVHRSGARHRAALAAARAALTAFTRTGDVEGIADAHVKVGLTLRRKWRTRTAAAVALAAALRAYTSLPNRAAAANTADILGDVLREHRQYRRAAVAHLHAAALFVELDIPVREIEASHALAKSLRRFRRAAPTDLLDERYDLVAPGSVAIQLGWALGSLDRWAEALALFDRTAAGAGDVRTESAALACRADALRALDRVEEAEQSAVAAHRLATDVGDARLVVGAARRLSVLVEERGEVDEALAVIGTALDDARRAGAPESTDGLQTQASILVRAGQLDDAVAVLRAALESGGSTRQQADTAALLAGCLLELNRHGEAVEAATLALRRYELPDTIATFWQMVRVRAVKRMAEKGRRTERAPATRQV